MKNDSIAAANPKAFHDYFIEEKYEAGIVLSGTEVKSLREGRASLRDSFARIENNEIFLHHCHISPYSHGNRANLDPLRVRKLLLHREEIRKLIGKTQQRGYTLVPLNLHYSKGRIKLEVGLGRGKLKHDKRAAEREREWNREKQRLLRHR